MPSPIAHGLVGLALGRLVAPPDLRSSARWYAFAVFAANAPDLDFAAGLATGQINGLHGGPTHSLLGVLVLAGASFVVARALGRDAARIALAAGVLCASHVLLDLLCGFPGRPTEFALLWPLSEALHSLPWHPFDGILHGNERAGPATFLRQLVLPHNLRAFAVEAGVFLPAVWLARRLVPGGDPESAAT